MLPHVPAHMIQRGNKRQACFFAHEDREAYLEWLGEYADRCRCRVHAHVLMTNHVYRLLSPIPRRRPGR